MRRLLLLAVLPGLPLPSAAAPAPTPLVDERASLQGLLGKAKPDRDEREPGQRPLPRTFLVFFNYGSSELTPEAMAELREAVAAAHGRRMMVTAHCDTSENSMELTRHRAEAVVYAIQAMGYPIRNATFLPKGAREPLVPTGPNVKEPQNRRAVIDLLP